MGRDDDNLLTQNSKTCNLNLFSEDEQGSSDELQFLLSSCLAHTARGVGWDVWRACVNSASHCPVVLGSRKNLGLKTEHLCGAAGVPRWAMGSSLATKQVKVHGGCCSKIPYSILLYLIFWGFYTLACVSIKISTGLSDFPHRTKIPFSNHL